MHVISRKTLRIVGDRHPESRPGLDHWFRVARKADWHDICGVRASFPHADAVSVRSGGVATVFNIAGNKYRLIAVIHYNRGKVYVALVLTHAEYSKNSWRDRL